MWKLYRKIQIKRGNRFPFSTKITISLSGFLIFFKDFKNRRVRYGMPFLHFFENFENSLKSFLLTNRFFFYLISFASFAKKVMEMTWSKNLIFLFSDSILFDSTNLARGRLSAFCQLTDIPFFVLMKLIQQKLKWLKKFSFNQNHFYVFAWI